MFLPSPPAAPSHNYRRNWSKMINEAPDGMSKTPAAALLRSARPKEING